jgi:hypothetical protein
LRLLYEKAFCCSIQRSAPQSSKSSGKPAEAMTVQDELKSELQDNEEIKDSYTLSQRTRSDLEEEFGTEAQYEECNEVLIFQLYQQMKFSDVQHFVKQDGEVQFQAEVKTFLVKVRVNMKNSICISPIIWMKDYLS